MANTVNVMTTETNTTPRGSYLNAWRTVPRELAYLLIAFPISVAGFGTTIGLFSGGIGTIFTFFIGLVLIVGALYVSRGFGTLDLILIEWARRASVARPEWMDARARTGFLGWLRAVVGNGHYWLYLLYVMFVDFIVKTISWTVTVVWISVGFGGLSYWFWDGFLPINERRFYLVDWILSRFGVDLASPALAEALAYLLLGIVFLITLPFITRGLVKLHWLIARGMLGAWKSDALQREVANLSESRGAAISAEGHSLRRLERDIHDGPQQRLVRLQMDLAAAERQLDGDPEKARALIAEAMQQSKDALDELRALSRGFAPPILMDRGLVAALESSAVRNPVPVRVTSLLPENLELPQEIERNAYFIASEALVNATKHAGATEIEVQVSARLDGEPPQNWLVIVVTDNGSGGARAVPEHGIAGLEERVRGLGGKLELVSPVGGPTVLTASLPIGAAKSE